MQHDEIAKGKANAELSVATMMTVVMARVAAAKQARAALSNSNEPSDPNTFSAPYVITMLINLDDQIDDQRRIDGEQWCLNSAKHRWCRLIDKRRGKVLFKFEHLHDATMFRLAN